MGYVTHYEKHFNTSGPVFPGKHYCIDPMKRIDWEEVRYLIDAEKYFVLHAPRQTGHQVRSHEGWRVDVWGA